MIRRVPEGYLQDLLTYMPDACLLVAPTGEILLLNSRAEELFGYETTELRGRPLDLLIPARFRQQHAQHVEKYVARPRARDMGSGLNLSGLRKDGSEIPVDISLIPIETSEGVRILAAIRDISQSEERYRAVFEQVAVGVAHSAKGGRFLNVNVKFCEICDYTRSEALALRIQELIHPNDLEKWVAGRADLLAGTISTHEERIRLIRKDGSPLWTLITTSLVRDATGKPLHFMSVIHDISAQVFAEQERHESEIRFRQVTENINEVFWLTDPLKSEMLYVSPAYESIWGRPVAELSTSPRAWVMAIYPEDRDRVLEAAQTKQLEGTYDEEYRIVRPDGDIRWIRDRAFPVRDENGNVVRVTGVAEDITAGKQAADELKESERRFSHMLQNVELVAIMLDRDRRITYCNDYLLQLAGWESHEVSGRSWFESFLPSEIHEELDEVFRSLIADQPAAWHYENEIVTRSGERRLIRWNNTVLRSASGDVIGVSSIGEDITEQRRAEERVRRLNRIYAVLSGINALIVRERDREQLLREACRIAVEAGGFSLAWAGLLDLASNVLKPVGWQRVSDDFMATLAEALQQADLDSKVLVGRAIREKRPVISNDLRHEPDLLTRAEVLALGSRAIVVLPLIVGEEVVGVLALHSRETGLVDEEEMKLLRELAGDISFALDHLEKADRVTYLALHDSLTDLPNRSLFIEHLEQSIATAREGGRLAVVAFDIERFRAINETLGRQAGDELLSRLAARSKRHLPDVTPLARIGPDQFAFVLPSATTSEAIVRRIEQRIQKLLGAPFAISESDVRVSARIGIAVFPGDAIDAEGLLHNAEAALRKAKLSGERYLFFAPEMTARAAEKLALETQLRSAVENQEFVLHYQAKVDLQTRRIAGVEALLRWHSRELEPVPAVKFIPLMEETGLILEAGTWALSQAVTDHARWLELGLQAPRVAVNISALQLRQRGFATTVREALNRGADPPGIDLEITESLLMESIEENIATLKSIRDFGVDIAIDDFGTGYSSLKYLARLPATSLKIDWSFVVTMLDDPDAMTLVQTVISLAHSLRLKVTAEGVETEEQAKLLRLLRCDEIQGHLIGQPVPFDEMTLLLSNKTA